MLPVVGPLVANCNITSFPDVFSCIGQSLSQIPPFNLVQNAMSMAKDFIPFVLRQSLQIFIDLTKTVNGFGASVLQQSSRESPHVAHDDGHAKMAVFLQNAPPGAPAAARGSKGRRHSLLQESLRVPLFKTCYVGIDVCTGVNPSFAVCLR